jgi:simple sugar transport system ATP-binding protein
MTTATTPVVAARGLVKRYGPTTALDGAGITVAPGEVHGLVGRNGAGKSTLVSLLTGLQTPDEGELELGGRPAPALSDRDAWREAVACVYQKSTIILDLSVAENLFLDRQSERGRPIRWPALRRRAAEVLERWDVAVDPAAYARDLSVETRQMVEIARSLSFGARFVILDEPTAQLDGPAVERLFDRIRALQAQGVTFLMISHHLEEVFGLCHTVTVYRDAQHVLTTPVADITHRGLVDAMTGEAAAGSTAREARPALPETAGDSLVVRGLTVDGHCQDVDLTVRAGEVVGLTGIGGSGKTPVAEVVAGLRTPSAGTVEVAGTRPKPGSVPAALRAGVGYVPQDRHREGLVPLLSVAENASLTIGDRLGRFGWIDARRRRRFAERMIGELDIKTDGPEQPVSGLSGGNAQKVVMARALATDPRVLVLVNPTAGVDVRAKESLLATVDAAARAGTAVLLVSDELEDLRVCDRVVVMFRGRVSTELPRGWTDHAMVAATEGVAP